MNNSERQKLKTYVATHRVELLTHLYTGERRGPYQQIDNYDRVQACLQALNIGTGRDNVEEAAGLVGTGLGRVVEVRYDEQAQQERKWAAGAKNAYDALIKGSTTVQAVINGVDVRLDNMQLKHQHPRVPIGDRQVKAGNQFVEQCDAAWHLANTLPHMAQWAAGLQNMKHGEKRQHGQSQPVDGIHYEGDCLMYKGQKYVLFHCYPANNSRLLWRR